MLGLFAELHLLIEHLLARLVQVLITITKSEKVMRIACQIHINLLLDTMLKEAREVMLEALHLRLDAIVLLVNLYEILHEDTLKPPPCKR